MPGNIRPGNIETGEHRTGNMETGEHRDWGT